jgi:hypothetical protein
MTEQRTASGGGQPDLAALETRVAALTTLVERLQRDRPPTDPTSAPRRVDFGYPMLLALLGRRGDDGRVFTVKQVGATRHERTVSFTSLPAGHAEVELTAEDGTVDTRPIDKDEVTTSIAAGLEITSVLVLDGDGRVVAVGPRLPAYTHSSD